MIASDQVGYGERLTLGAVQRQIVAVITGGNGTAAIHEFRLQHATHHLEFLVRWRDKHARRKSAVDGKSGGVFSGDQQAAGLDKLLEMRNAGLTQARTDVVAAGDAANIRRECSGLPRQRIAVHRQAIDDEQRLIAAGDRADAADGRAWQRPGC